MTEQPDVDALHTTKEEAGCGWGCGCRDFPSRWMSNAVPDICASSFSYRSSPYTWVHQVKSSTSSQEFAYISVTAN